MPTQVASLYGVLTLDDSDYTRKLTGAQTGASAFGSRMSAAASNVGRLGTTMAVTGGAALGAFGVAVNQAMGFDEALTNVAAVMGLSREEAKNLGDQILNIGMNSRAGPEAAMNAMYDIAGGVADATTHMAILDAAIATSEAGNSDLQATTNALIAVMNGYGLSAEEAQFASDVLTQTVGKGVGTMDQFASALPQVTGLAASLGIPLQSVGSMMAFLTTKGNSASTAATMLGAQMSALMKPNADMKKALSELGYESGEAAIQQLGLVGALQAISQTSTAGSEGMAALLGTQEAVRGSVALLGEEFEGFKIKFMETMLGATEAARGIQNEGITAQWERLQASLAGVAILVGQALVPALSAVWRELGPIVVGFASWVQQNPQTVLQVALGAVAFTGLGLVLKTVSMVMGVATIGAKLLGGALGLILSPAGLLIALIGGIIFAASQLYPGGLPQLLTDAATAAQQLGQILMIVLGRAVQWVKDRIAELVTTVQNAVNGIRDFASQIGSGLGAYGGALQNAEAAARMVASGQVTPGQAIQAFGNAVGSEFSGIFQASSSSRTRLAQQIASRYTSSRDSGGSGMAGQPYLIGTGAQPELFVPHTSGTFEPNAGGVTVNGGIHIHANSREEGYRAMDGALARARARGY